MSRKPKVKTEEKQTDLDRLKIIVYAVEAMAEDERMRAFTYLKSRYSKYIPSDNY